MTGIMTETLFPELVPIEPEATESLAKVSAGRRLTIRQRRDVDRGRHPLTGSALTTVEGATCGSCLFRVRGRFAKCHWRRDGVGPFPYITSGPATDCRAWWPGCTLWMAKP